MNIFLPFDTITLMPCNPFNTALWKVVLFLKFTSPIPILFLCILVALFPCTQVTLSIHLYTAARQEHNPRHDSSNDYFYCFVFDLHCVIHPFVFDGEIYREENEKGMNGDLLFFKNLPKTLSHSSHSFHSFRQNHTNISHIPFSRICAFHTRKTNSYRIIHVRFAVVNSFQHIRFLSSITSRPI